VDSVVITDENGNPIDPKNVEFNSSPLDGKDAIEWTVTFTTDKIGTQTYKVAGVYANGYTDPSKAVSVTVIVEAPPTVDAPEDDPDGETPDDTDDDVLGEDNLFDKILDFLFGIFRKIVDFFRFILSVLVNAF
jgi:hypothetical protein